MSSAEREDRIDQLVTLCIKKNITPNKNTFAGFIQIASISRFAVSKHTATDYANTLVKAWNSDRWKRLARKGFYLSLEEKTEWITKH